MARHRSPSFFKILLDPSAPHLPLPPDFITKHLKNRIPKHPIVRSAIGGHQWRLKMKKIGECFCFCDGWDAVVRDAGLGFGDFLVFRVVGDTRFKMAVYSPNGCEKELQKAQVDDGSGSGIVDDHVVEDVVVEDDVDDDVVDEDGDYDDDEEVEDDDEEDEDEEEYEDEDEDDDEVEEEEDDVEDDGDGDGDGDGGGDIDIDGHEGDPFFMLVITKGHNKMLRLPLDFVELAGIDKEGTLTAANRDGTEWPIGLRAEPNGRYCLSSGWMDFRRSNDLCEGDECVFKYIKSEDKLLLARVSKNKRPPSAKGEKRKVWNRPYSGKVPVTKVKVPATNIVTRAAGGGGGVKKGVKRARGRPQRLSTKK